MDSGSDLSDYHVPSSPNAFLNDESVSGALCRRFKGSRSLLNKTPDSRGPQMHFQLPKLSGVSSIWNSKHQTQKKQICL